MVAKTVLRFSTFSLLTAILLVSCKKGDMGPAGATGATGATGANGATGDAGPKGTANVIYSAWVTANTFRDTTIDLSLMRAGNVTAPQIVDSILNKGAVMVYFSFGSTAFLLPYTSYAAGKPSTISYTPLPGKILITRFTYDNSNAAVLPVTLLYRYIIIPGGIAGRQATVDYRAMTYQQVCAYLNIPE